VKPHVKPIPVQLSANGQEILEGLHLPKFPPLNLGAGHHCQQKRLPGLVTGGLLSCAVLCCSWTLSFICSATDSCRCSCKSGEMGV